LSDGLLLIHAFPLDASLWEGQVAEFSSRLPVVAPHLPGFGGTEMSGDVMTMGSAADRCFRALGDAGVDRVVVCGLSMGGYVAFELMRRRRSIVFGLALANTRAEGDPPEAAEKRRDLAERLLREGNVLAASPPPLLSEHAPDELRKRVRATIADQPASSIAAAALGMAERPDSSPDLPGIDVPTLVLTSTDDALIPRELSAPMAAAIPGAELVVLEGVGHLTNLEAPDEFNRRLGAFLDRCGVP
jgi:3-oxoadipate enol-lactonase